MSLDLPLTMSNAAKHAPFDVTLLATRLGSLDTEREIQGRFAAARHRGKWFRKTPELPPFVAGGDA